MASPELDEANRPSFTSFWQRSREALTARKITFVPSTSAAGPSDLAGEDSTEYPAQSDKAQHRRAQVRKAQIQHRQRKANYVKQLELDVAQLRDLISGSECETEALRAENEAMRTQIRDAVGQLSVPSNILPKSNSSDSIPMGLGFDKVLNAPSYRIRVSSSEEEYETPKARTVQPPVKSERQDQGQDGGRGHLTLSQMSPEQTHLAINFILALEHICWDHFDHSDFRSSTAPTGPESGHTLMASSLALRNAPSSVFDGVITTKQNMRSPDPSSRQTPVPPDVSWQASGLTLQSLYGLASSVNPSDVDLTPVQAWFELAADYPMGLLLRTDIMDTLKTELIGVVKCPHYGAVIERTAFESVASRVLDQALATWKMEHLGQGGFQ